MSRSLPLFQGQNYWLTREAVTFTNALYEFEKLNLIESHRKFAEKYNLKVTLLSEGEREVLRKYDVWRLKEVDGKDFWGVVMSAFLINPVGKIAH